MDVYGLLILLVIGALAGWLAGNIMRGGGYGLIGNIIVGLIGSIVGGFVFNWLGISAAGMLGLLLAGVVGAVILLFIISLVKRA